METHNYNNAKLNKYKTIVFLLILQFIITLSILLLSASVLKSQQISLDGGCLVVSGNLVIGSDFDFNNDGTFTCNSGSKVTFKGTQKQQIKGSNVINFYDLEINNSSSGVELQRSIGINGEIKLTDGNLDILDRNLNLRTGATMVGEHNGSMVISSAGSGNYSSGQDAGNGQIIKSINITTSGVTNAGGLGISITPTANFGNTTIIRKHQRIVGSSGDNSIFRTYTITPTNSSNLEAQIVFNYNSSNEMNGNNSGDLKLYQKKPSAKGYDWEELSSSDNGSSVTATTNDNNLSELEITAAGTNKTLPVSLISFKAICNEGITIIKWQTASEINNDYFKLERSSDGVSFEEIARITGAGNSNSLINYEYIDGLIPTTRVYYRLTQVDFDGKYEVFKIITTDCSGTSQIKFTYVNPVQNKQITIFSSGIPNEEINIRLFTNTGKCVLSEKLEGNKTKWIINTDNLSKGIYHLIIQNELIINSGSVIIL